MRAQLSVRHGARLPLFLDLRARARAGERMVNSQACGPFLCVGTKTHTAFFVHTFVHTRAARGHESPDPHSSLLELHCCLTPLGIARTPPCLQPLSGPSCFTKNAGAQCTSNVHSLHRNHDARQARLRPAALACLSSPHTIPVLTPPVLPIHALTHVAARTGTQPLAHYCPMIQLCPL